MIDDNTESANELLGQFKVLDFSSVMAGPFCTRLMADLGADVIKVETFEGDQMRHRPPVRQGASSYFANLNCGKKSIVLDLKSGEGRQLARDLSRRADVVIENFRPGVMKRLGLGYEELSASNARLVYCSISGFGQTGPYAERPAYAPVLHAASGFDVANFNYQDGLERPLNCGTFIADVLGGVYAFSAIQSALLHREKSGVGQSIDVSMMEAMLSMLVYEVQEAQFPQGKRRFLFTPCRASDGFLMIAPTSQRNFEQFCDAIDQPDLKLDVRFTKQRIREQHWPELMEIVEQWTSTRAAKVCEEHFLSHGVPCSRYNSVGDLLDDPQALHRGTFEKIEDAAGSLRVTNPPFRFSRGRALARNKIAALGEDSEAVLQSELGLNVDDIRKLRESGIVG